MAREPLPLGTAGKVARRRKSETRWVARALFRDADGKTRPVEASGPTGAKAEKALKEKIRDRSGLFGGEITPETRMHVLVDKWIEDLGHSELRPQTRDEYIRLARTTIIPALGQLRVREISVSRVEFFLRAIEHDQNKPALARNAYVLLKQIVQVAVRHDALAFNPVDNARQPRKVHKEVRSLDELELAAVRRAVRQWQAGYGKPGPKPTTLMPDAIDLLLATALRIGELLALRWRDVDFEATPPTLTVSGTLVEVKGQSLFRQEFPKTAAGHRILTLPEFAVSMLRRRRAETSDDRDDAPIFQSRTGGWFYPANFGRLWRTIRKEHGLDHITPHVFRKTVATMIDHEMDPPTAAEVLGHANDRTTRKHYIVARPSVAPDVSPLLEKHFAPAPQGAGQQGPDRP